MWQNNWAVQLTCEDPKSCTGSHHFQEFKVNTKWIPAFLRLIGWLYNTDF